MLISVNKYTVSRIKHMHIRLCIIMSVALWSPFVASADDGLKLFGRVQESVFKTDLPGAWVWTIGSDGERADSIPMGRYIGNLSQFMIEVSHADSLYVFEVGCEGYTTQTFTYRVENARNDFNRHMPPFLLDRAPHNLNEVTVTASKIKFCHRGDTLVYNADAFQLAEGSMLDGLIKQLPGAELSGDGRITINGEFVETLLLDGKPFFDGNNNLMLKNLGAYMVKNVEVYRGQTEMEKFMDEAPKHLTMNVKLKKEYNIGWIGNLQAGYGMDDRYLGRLFAAWFNPRMRIGLVANFNNLNDTRTPGSNDSWTPEQMPSGTRRRQMAGLTYDVSSADKRRSLAGNVTYENNSLDSRTVTDRTNFFSEGNTYDNGSRMGRDKDYSITSRHQYNVRISRVGINGRLKGSYNRRDRRAASVSASFNRQLDDAIRNNLEAIYGSAMSEEVLGSLINRSVTRSDMSAKAGGVELWNNLTYKVPFAPGMLRVANGIKYDTRKEWLWDDYDIAYGYNRSSGGPLESSRKRNYTDNSPNHDFSLESSLVYLHRIGEFSFNFGYEYKFSRHRQDSYMYALDRLADMGVYGALPQGYAAAFDPANSFMSTQWDNRHSAVLQAGYDHGPIERNFSVDAGIKVGRQHSRMNYFSDGRFYPVRRNSTIATVASMNTRVVYSLDRRAERKSSHFMMYEYTMDTETPDMLHLVDVKNTSDPLNIDLGNPGLKNAYRHKHMLQWRTSRSSRSNNLMLTAVHTSNALLRGYVYDMMTGVRYNRTYNVKGNYSLNASDTYSLQFGGRKQFTLSSTTEAGLIHSVEMVGEINGTDVADPAPGKVDNRTLSENLSLSWRIGGQTLSVNGRVTDTRTSRQRYADINATHYSYGVRGQFALPAGFAVSTDFTCYTRRGYGVRELDTTDAVWNARLSYTPRNGRWVFSVDGFDLLHQLSNVSYAVTATGRTVTVTNTLPRYVLASVQYRFNINPRVGK